MTSEIQQEEPLAETTQLPAEAIRHDPYAALRYRDFRLLTLGRLIASMGEQMVSVAIGWELYERTGDAFALGLVGLVQILPIILLVLVSGHIADRFNRRRIVVITQVLLSLCSVGLAVLSASEGSLVLVYGCLLLIGTARAFNGPATATLLPQTIPPEIFASAATWSSSAWQLAAVLGPAIGGLLIGIFHSATEVFVLDAVAALIFGFLATQIRGRHIAQSTEGASLESLARGFRFIWNTKIILATITLDLFAVLFGGAVALLPIFAKDILNVGPEGLGWLRTAPSVGALVMVIALTHLPPIKRAGIALLWAVIGFGIATIIFGISRSFVLSLVMLALLGSLDNISVVVRSTLLLSMTPDEMRGRVSAVNSVFVGASNELGAFEFGVVASIFNPVIAVIGGGIGTIVVVIWVMWKWPQVRKLASLHSLTQESG